MYHSNFDYCGYGLRCQNNEIPNSCVPSYILKLYNNKDETNPRQVIKKLTMKILLKELEMERIDEGCCLNQIIKFCNNRKIIYYALDFKFKTVSSNNEVLNHQIYHD